MNKNDFSVVTLGGSLTISLNDSDRTNISKMNHICSQENFMCWTLSEEGKNWLKEHSDEIKNTLFDLVNKF